MRHRSMVMVVAALALLVVSLVPATAQLAVGGLVTLQSQDREHSLELQSRLAVTAKFGSEVIGAAHFGVVPSITQYVDVDFLFTPDNYSWRDIRENFGNASLIPSTGPHVTVPLVPVYTDNKLESKRQPAAFRFSVPRTALQTGMTYSVKLTLNLSKTSRTFYVFVKRSGQTGFVSFSLNVRRMPEPADAVQAFYQLLGFDPLIDVEQRQANTGGQQANAPNGEVAELREQVARLTGAVSDLVAKVTAGESAPANPPPAANQAPTKPVADTPPTKPVKAYTVNVLFRNADGTTLLNRDGEARVCLDGQPHLVPVTSGKGQVTVDLDPNREYQVSYEMRVRTRTGWSGWSSPSSGTAVPGKYDSFEAACNWAARRI